MSFLVSFSGPRPSSLGGWNWDSEVNKGIRKYFNDKVRNIILEHGNEEVIFVSGMAAGFDMFMASVVLDLKQEFKDIILVAAIPFRDQPCVWDEEWISRYNSLLKRCDNVVYVDDIPQYKVESVEVGSYHIAKLFSRNDYMASIMDLGLVLSTGSTKGGTADFILRARKKDKQIDITELKSIYC